MNKRYLKYRNKSYSDRFGGNREKAILRDGSKCVKCGMTREEHKKKYNRDITVDHIDGRGTYTPIKERNNALDNLQTLCARCHGLKDVVKCRPLGSVVQMTLTGDIVKFWVSQMEAQRHGFSNSKISEVVTGKRNMHGGFIWKRVVI